VAGAGEQLARVLWAVGETMPKDFWIANLSSDWRFNENLRVLRGAERPMLHIEGRSREGTGSPAQLFGEFISGMSQRLGSGLSMAQNPSPSFDKFTLDLTLFAPPPPPAAAPADEGTN
jgi:hypothetical protein